MRIGLHDADAEHLKGKRFPNLALMKLSAYHKVHGDTVDWWMNIENEKYDRVYSSKVMAFTPENPYLPPNTLRGGTGYGLFNDLPPEIDNVYPDYSIYPNCDYAVGYTTRGCPNNCDFCVVPIKEGTIREYTDWKLIVRKDTNILVLMDNNILASDYGIRQLAEISQTDYRLDLNQGMDVTLLDEDIVKIFARIKWLEYIRFSCDDVNKLPYFVKMAELFKKHGIGLSKIYIYVLVRKDLEAADYCVQGLHKIYKNFNLYAQAERNIGVVPDKLQFTFAQRYVFKGLYRKETWEQYCGRHDLWHG